MAPSPLYEVVSPAPPLTIVRKNSLPSSNPDNTTLQSSSLENTLEKLLHASVEMDMKPHRKLMLNATHTYTEIEEEQHSPATASASSSSSSSSSSSIHTSPASASLSSPELVCHPDHRTEQSEEEHEAQQLSISLTEEHSPNSSNRTTTRNISLSTNATNSATTSLVSQTVKEASQTLIHSPILAELVSPAAAAAEEAAAFIINKSASLNKKNKLTSTAAAVATASTTSTSTTSTSTSSLSSTPSSSLSSSLSLHVLIPSSFCSCLIGKNGSTLHSLRTRHQIFIDLADPSSSIPSSSSPTSSSSFTSRDSYRTLYLKGDAQVVLQVLKDILQLIQTKKQNWSAQQKRLLDLTYALSPFEHQIVKIQLPPHLSDMKNKKEIISTTSTPEQQVPAAEAAVAAASIIIDTEETTTTTNTSTCSTVTTSPNSMPSSLSSSKTPSPLRVTTPLPEIEDEVSTPSPSQTMNKSSLLFALNAHESRKVVGVSGSTLRELRAKTGCSFELLTWAQASSMSISTQNIPTLDEMRYLRIAGLTSTNMHVALEAFLTIISQVQMKSSTFQPRGSKKLRQTLQVQVQAPVTPHTATSSSSTSQLSTQSPCTESTQTSPISFSLSPLAPILPLPIPIPVLNQSPDHNVSVSSPSVVSSSNGLGWLQSVHSTHPLYIQHMQLLRAQLKHLQAQLDYYTQQQTRIRQTSASAPANDATFPLPACDSAVTAGEAKVAVAAAVSYLTFSTRAIARQLAELQQRQQKQRQLLKAQSLTATSNHSSLMGLQLVPFTHLPGSEYHKEIDLYHAASSSTTSSSVSSSSSSPLSSPSSPSSPALMTYEDWYAAVLSQEMLYLQQQGHVPCDGSSYVDFSQIQTVYPGTTPVLPMSYHHSLDSAHPTSLSRSSSGRGSSSSTSSDGILGTAWTSSESSDSSDTSDASDSNTSSPSPPSPRVSSHKDSENNTESPNDHPVQQNKNSVVPIQTSVPTPKSDDTQKQSKRVFEIIHVDEQMIGQLIGPGGATIQHIRETTRAVVRLAKSSGNSKQRQVYLSAAHMNQLKKAKDLVMNIIRTNTYKGPNPSQQTVTKQLVR